jgi:hypothetical protein
MSEERSNNWTLWLAGIVATILTSAIFMMGTNLIASDKESRCRDSEIEDKVADICEKQNSVNQEILVTLASIKTDLIYIKKATGARGN